MRLSNIVERFWYSRCRPRLSQASSPRQGAISSTKYYNVLQGTTITLNLSKMKLNCQSIYGNLKKRRSSTPSRGKSCVNLTSANDGPGCATCA